MLILIEKTICIWCQKEFQPEFATQKHCCKKHYDLDQKLLSLLSPAKSRYVIFNRDSFTCLYCGRSSYKDGSKLHIDHLVPKSRGGTDQAGNVVTACDQCNLGKSSKIISDLDNIRLVIEQRNKMSGIDPRTLIRCYSTEKLEGEKKHSDSPKQLGLPIFKIKTH